MTLGVLITNHVYLSSFFGRFSADRADKKNTGQSRRFWLGATSSYSHVKQSAPTSNMFLQAESSGHIDVA